MVPGPPPLPIVGNTLMINAKRLHMQLYDLAKKHGPVMKLMIFNEPVIILNSIDACLEAKLKRGILLTILLARYLSIMTGFKTICDAILYIMILKCACK